MMTFCLLLRWLLLTTNRLLTLVGWGPPRAERVTTSCHPPCYLPPPIPGEGVATAGRATPTPSPRLPHLSCWRRASRAGWMPVDKLFFWPPASHASLSTVNVVRGSVWASMEERACPQITASRHNSWFYSPVDHCMAHGLKACVTITHTSGQQLVTLLCSLPAPNQTAASPAGKQQRHWQHGYTTKVAVDEKSAGSDVPLVLAATEENTSSPTPSPFASLSTWNHFSTGYENQKKTQRGGAAEGLGVWWRTRPLTAF
jgi:hypothetical protein